MALFRKMEDTVRLELTSADTQGAFGEMLKRGISLYSVYRFNELVTGFTIKRAELPVLRSILDSRGDKIHIVRESEMKVLLARIRNRPVLLLGLVSLIFLTLFIPTRLILFRIEGNTTVSASQILEEVHSQGVGFWSKRKDVKSEDIKNELIVRIPQLIWVGIKTKGCVATISVLERNIENRQDISVPGSIYATRDGIISSITASRGTALCSPGDAVLEGQLLISGFTDCGRIMLLEQAEGEIYAYTSRMSRSISPTYRYIEHPASKTKYRFSLVIGKKRINFWKGSGIYPSRCDRMYQEYWLKLPGGGVLPVRIIRETVIYQELGSVKKGYNEAELSDALEMYIRQQTLGGKILHREISFTEADDLLILDGKFGCLEMIGKKKVEQIGENVWQER